MESRCLSPGSSSGTNAPSDLKHVCFPLWASVSTRASVKRRVSVGTQWDDIERDWPSVETQKNLHSACDSPVPRRAVWGSVRKHMQSSLLQAWHTVGARWLVCTPCMMGSVVSLQISYVEALTPSISECDCIWRERIRRA